MLLDSLFYNLGEITYGAPLHFRGELRRKREDEEAEQKWCFGWKNVIKLNRKKRGSLVSYR